MQTLTSIVKTALHLLLPGHCLLCRQTFAAGVDPWLCYECEGKLAYVEAPQCQRCGASGGHSAMCGQCPEDMQTDQHRSLALHNDSFSELLHTFKYMQRRELHRTFARLTFKRNDLSRYLSSFDLIVPVPLHKERLQQRGYNQAQLIAGSIAKQYGIPMQRQLLARPKATKMQSELGRRARKQNVKDAFCLHQPMGARYGRLLLVDDVLTTGATLNAAAAVLRQAKVAQFIGSFSLTRARKI